MNRLLMSLLVLIALALGAMPAKAVTITYSTSGSNTTVFLQPISSGDITDADSTFSLSEKLIFGSSTGGHYGQAFTYIPFTVSDDGFLSATVSDLHLTNAAAKALKWLSLALYEYTGGEFAYLGCGGGSSLCTLDAYDAHDPLLDSGPTVASISSALVAGSQYLLKVGFGLCGCSGTFGGIDLKVATSTTPVPPAVLMFLTGIGGLGAIALRRRKSAATV